MAKKGEKSCIIDVLQAEIGRYSSQLQSCIDKDALLKAYQTRRRSERLYAYHSILRDACCSCFRGTSMSNDGKKCVVWGFNGRYWTPLSPVVFRDSVGQALIAAAGAGDFVVKGDWIEKQGTLLQSAYAGVCVSPLEKNPAIVGFRNGIWDFSDIENPVYHSFADMMPVTDLLGYDYDPTASCKMWQSFLSMMLSQKDILKLQKYLGLGCVNRRLMSNVVEDTLWLIGSGANGKTTIEEVVRAVYGYNNVSEASMGELLDRNQISRMLTMSNIDGKIFNICSEVDVNDISRGSDAFKRLCSGEPQNARGIGENVRRIYDIPFLIFSMNQRPVNKRMDSAFRRRIVEIVFNQSIREEDMDAGLGDKLKKELSGIRNWMIEGYKMLVRDGFRFDHTNSEDYMEYNDQFFDIFARHDGLRASAWAGRGEKAQLVSFATLYDRYVDFCQRKGYGQETPSEKSLSQDLKRLNFRKVRKAAGIFYEVYCENELDYAVKL